ncbi:MAG: hypothetical protein O8C67_00305 [Candidatus Methanoperedens sp.]|nr:hypothetical protein [Candidatus Methanoperedens sp.]
MTELITINKDYLLNYAEMKYTVLERTKATNNETGELIRQDITLLPPGLSLISEIDMKDLVDVPPTMMFDEAVDAYLAGLGFSSNDPMRR